MTMPRLTDRELLFQHQEDQRVEAEALAQIERYRAIGMGLAACALAMWAALDGSGLERDERVALIQAALTGR